MSIILIISLFALSQNPAKPALDLTGSWRDAPGGQTWTIRQNGSQVTIVTPRGVTINGTLDKNSLRYTDQTTMTDATSKACQSYIGQTFYFPSQFRISKGGTRLERKAPASVTKGQCKLDIRKLPVIALNRV